MNRKLTHLHDHGLWDEVTRTIKPLGHKPARKTKPAITPHVTTLQLGANQTALLRPLPASTAPAKPHKSPPQLTGFDRRTEQKMMRGKVEIEARIDLHGLSLELARHQLLQFLSAKRDQGYRTVLVITGKGASPFASHTLHGRDHFYAPEREGRLRRSLPDWLHDASFRALVTGFQPAHPKHGGGGAFYVRLRRHRENP